MSEQQTGQIFALIPKIMQEVGAIGKDRKNPQQGYSFRGIDDVYNALQGPLSRNGVFVVPEVVDRHREERQTKSGSALIYTVLTVKHTLYAPDGSSVSAVTVGEAMDSGDKSSNKAMSAAMKYALLEVFSIPTEGDNDTENQSHDVKPQGRPQQQRQPGNAGGGAAPMTEDEKYIAILNEAFDDGKFSAKDRGDVVAAVCKKKKINRITELSAEDRRKLLDSIVNGDIKPSKAA